jgi:hypothetical protein
MRSKRFRAGKIYTLTLVVRALSTKSLFRKSLSFLARSLLPFLTFATSMSAFLIATGVYGCLFLGQGED